MAASPLPALAAIAGVTSHLLLSPIYEPSTIKILLTYLVANTLLFPYLILSTSLESPLNIFLAAVYQWITLNTVFLIAGIGLTLIRRFFFSGISHIPGPPLARLSKLWDSNQFRIGRASITRKALHEKFNSDFIRIGPNAVSVRCVEGIEKIYKGRYPRGPFYEIARGSNLNSTRDYKIHQPWRRLW